MGVKVLTAGGGGVHLQGKSTASDVTVYVPNNNGATLRDDQTAIVTNDLADGVVTPAKLSQKMILGTAKATTSGTAFDFTGIPSWVKRITVMLADVSTNGSSLIQVQVGAGSVTTTGYVAAATSATATPVVGSSTTGFLLMGQNGSTGSANAHVVLTNISGGTWVASVIGINAPTTPVIGGGVVTLSGTLDRVRLTTVNGTDAFDAGSVNILYEG